MASSPKHMFLAGTVFTTIIVVVTMSYFGGSSGVKYVFKVEERKLKDNAVFGINRSNLPASGSPNNSVLNNTTVARPLSSTTSGTTTTLSSTTTTNTTTTLSSTTTAVPTTTTSPFKTTLPPTPRPDVCDGCFPHDFHYIISPVQACRALPGQTIDLVMVINSVPNRRDMRNAIRETWALFPHNNGSVRHVFLFGRPKDPDVDRALLLEAAEWGDILQEDFVDSYANLTLKTIMAFTWVSRYCSSSKFVLKTDDDVFNNPKALLGKTKSENLTQVVFGACNPVASPIRDRNSKWYASELQYPHGTYKGGFCSGTGYAMETSVAKAVAEVSKHVPFLYLEDVYVALCINKLDLRLKRVGGFMQGPNIYTPEGKCNDAQFNNTVTIHGMDASGVRKAWSACGHLGRL